MNDGSSMRPIGRALRSVWVCTLLGVVLWPAAAQGSDLVLGIGSSTVLFSELDGGIDDEDGVVDGTLTLSSLTMTDMAEILVDVRSARFVVTGGVQLSGTSAIHGLDDLASQALGITRYPSPHIEIEAGGDIVLTGSSSVASVALTGGAVRLCAGGDLVVGGDSRVSASVEAAVGEGGALYLEAGNRLQILEPGGTVEANGADGGAVTLVSCGTGAAGSGSVAQDAAMAVLGRVEAIGADGAGGTVLIEARQGGASFDSLSSVVDARGSVAAGSVAVSAASEVSPSVPPSQPAATVKTGTPSSLPCDCSHRGPTVPSLVVAADVDRPTGVAGTLFTFSGRVVESTASVNDWRWSLSDGQELSGQTVTASFPAPGIYGATLTVTDTDGQVVVAETGVVVFDPETQAPPEMQLPPVIGDVNGNGVLNLADAVLTLQHMNGLKPLSAESLPAADIDLDGEVTDADARFMAEALAEKAPLPTVLLPDHGAPGTTVNVISPELLDPTALIEVQVGASAWTQMPIRTVRGYTTIMVPFDATVEGSMEVQPGPVDVRVLADGVVVETLTFEVEAPSPQPTNPKAELVSFLEDYVELLELNRMALADVLAFAAVDGIEEDLALATFIGAYEDGLAKVADLEALLEEPGGDDLARLFFLNTTANGYDEYRQAVAQFAASRRAELEGLHLAVKAGTIDTEGVLRLLCAISDVAELLKTGSDILGGVCDGLLYSAVVAAVVPFDGPAVDSGALAAWAGGCSSVETALELAFTINKLIGKIEPDLRFNASTDRPMKGQSVELEAHIELVGLDDLCTHYAGKTKGAIKNRLAKAVVARLLKKKLALRAIAKLSETLSDELLDRLKKKLSGLVKDVIDETTIANALNELSTKLCDSLQQGVPLTEDLSNILTGPLPDVGDLFFNYGGTASFLCPATGSLKDPTVDFFAARNLCGQVDQKSVTIQCQTSTVWITMGDDGNALDDVFEVWVGGVRLIAPGYPVREVRERFELAHGDYTLELRAISVPDDIDTFFLEIAGATVLSGGPLLYSVQFEPLLTGDARNYLIRVE